MADGAVPTREYYAWVERLFRVLDDIDRTAACRFAAAGTRPGTPALTSARALDALGARLRSVLGEGRRAEFSTGAFNEGFEALFLLLGALGEADRDVSSAASRARFETALTTCRRAVFSHQLY